MIRYALVADGFTSLKVYDMVGKHVATLVNQYQTRGTYVVPFDAARLSAGVYTYGLQQEGTKMSKRMVLVK